MTTFYVKKDGSGTHTQIQSAVFDAVNGDTINIGLGTFYENIELYKSITLEGAGKDQTIIQGKLAADTFSGLSFFAGEDVLTVTSTAGLIRGRIVTATGITAGSRVSQIISDTQIKISLATATTGNIAKTGCTWSSGVTAITLPSTTAVVVGMKVSATGINALVTAYNTTTRVVTLSAATTAAGSNATINFISYKSGLTLTMPALFSGSTFPSTIQVMNVATNFFAIKKMKVIGFDGIQQVECPTIGMTNPASSGTHQNWLIDDCEIVANGDGGLTTSPNFNSLNGTIQNCIFSGKTFAGSEPADVPAFSSFTLSGCQITGASTVSVSSTKGIVAGTASTGSPISGTAIQASTYVTAINGNELTLSKTVIGSVGDIISCTFTNVQFYVPNVPRQLVVIGNSSSVTNCINTVFKNNTITGQTGAIISATGNKSIFNTAVTVDTVGGLVEGNLIDGIIGAGDPNLLASNYAIRARGTTTIVQNNTDKITGGRGNSGYYVLGTSINNIILNKMLVNAIQSISGGLISVDISKEDLKLVSKVASDAVFSNETNWHLVSCIFKKQSMVNRMFTALNDFAGIRQMKLRGAQPGDRYELVKIIISKADRTLLVLNRSEIPDAASMDITLL